MKIKIKDLESMLVKASTRFVSLDEAKYFAREQLDNHIKSAPRTNGLDEALGDIESWVNNPKSKIVKEVDKGASFLLNFNKLGPSLKLKYIHDELKRRAKKYGISILGIRNSHGLHTLNLWTDGLGKQDLIGVCMFNGGPDAVIPFGGTRGIFGTNPISYAIPTLEKPIIADFATSEIPFFEIRNAKKEGIRLRKGVAVDEFGKITTDPTKALDDTGTSNLVSLGNSYKGYAIVLLVEILTGSLVKSLLSTEQDPSYINEEHGGIIIAIDISSLSNLKIFKESVTKMINGVRKQRPTTGIRKITIPGDRSYQRAEKTLRSGKLEIERELIDKLEKLA